MSVLIFTLKHVVEDEAEDVRQLLRDNNIDFYETSDGIFGFSMPAIWLRDDAQAARAKQLIDEYQLLRQQRVQRENELNPRTLKDMIFENPLRYFTIILVIGILLFFMTYSFVRFV